MRTRTPRVDVSAGVIQLALKTRLRDVVIAVVLCLEKRGAGFVRQLCIAVHIEVHLFELLVSHNIDGFLSALEVEFKLSIFFI